MGPQPAPTPAWIVFPNGLNWFYERAAVHVRDALQGEGIPTRLCAAAALDRAAEDGAETVLVVSARECVATLTQKQPFLDRLRSFRRRILVNYDCIYSEWFRGNFTLADDLLTEVADVNIQAQTDAGTVLGISYTWIPESLTTEERRSPQPWNPERPLPWAIVAHSTDRRSALLDSAVRRLGPNGFAFLPTLRPYHEGSGTLPEAALDRVLRKARLYVWNSHHAFPFHECVRAPQAVRNGAIPAKIDPFFAERFPEVPWVFPDLRALAATIQASGLAALYERCQAFLLERSMETRLAALVRGTQPRLRAVS